jgi:hypothetical protein
VCVFCVRVYARTHAITRAGEYCRQREGRRGWEGGWRKKEREGGGGGGGEGGRNRTNATGLYIVRVSDLRSHQSVKSPLEGFHEGLREGVEE